MSYYTPCDAVQKAANYYAVGSCNTRCQAACKEASKCTTAVVSHMCARDCTGGAVGEDAQGCCRPAFGDLRNACDAFTTNCTSCSDSDACAAACAKVRQNAACVVDESAKFPDKCPSSDCTTCVGSCGSCTSGQCAAWCDAYYAPKAHCVGDVAQSVQDSFIDQSLLNRDAPDLAAMGKFYDSKCKAVNMKGRQVVVDDIVQTRERSPYRGRGLELELAAVDPFNKRLRDQGQDTVTWATVTEAVIESRRKALQEAQERQLARRAAAAAISRTKTSSRTTTSVPALVGRRVPGKPQAAPLKEKATKSQLNQPVNQPLATRRLHGGGVIPSVLRAFSLAASRRRI